MRNVQKNREYAKRYYEKNRDAILARRAAAYAADPSRQNAAVARYREANPTRVKAERQVRDSRRRATLRAGDLTTDQWLEILEEFDNSCAYCQARGVPLQIEHMTPIARGGGHTRLNVVPACAGCNSKKQARTIFQFLMLP